MNSVRIVPTSVGYEVWCNSVLVCTTQSRAAAREELNYLRSLEAGQWGDNYEVIES